MYAWSFSLDQFLRHSNEDAISAKFIGRLLARLAHSRTLDFKGALRIVDIGCGPGSKALRIAECLCGQGIKVDMQLVDADERWSTAIEENVNRLGPQSDICISMQCPRSADSWAQSNDQPLDVAQFLHVAYDDESEEMVYRIGAELAKKHSLLIISAEHPKSELSALRRKLNKLGYGELPSQRVTALASRFRRKGLIVRQYTLEQKYLDIGPIDELRGKGWFWDLIAGQKNGLRNSKEELIPIIDQYTAHGEIGYTKSRVLYIPDSLIIVRQRP